MSFFTAFPPSPQPGPAPTPTHTPTAPLATRTSSLVDPLVLTGSTLAGAFGQTAGSGLSPVERLLGGEAHTASSADSQRRPVKDKDTKKRVPASMTPSATVSGAKSGAKSDGAPDAAASGDDTRLIARLRTWQQTLAQIDRTRKGRLDRNDVQSLVGLLGGTVAPPTGGGSHWKLNVDGSIRLLGSHSKELEPGEERDLRKWLQGLVNDRLTPPPATGRSLADVPVGYDGKGLTSDFAPLLPGDRVVISAKGLSVGAEVIAMAPAGVQVRGDGKALESVGVTLAADPADERRGIATIALPSPTASPAARATMPAITLASERLPTFVYLRSGGYDPLKDVASVRGIRADWVTALEIEGRQMVKVDVRSPAAVARLKAILEADKDFPPVRTEIQGRRTTFHIPYRQAQVRLSHDGDWAYFLTADRPPREDTDQSDEKGSPSPSRESHASARTAMSTGAATGPTTDGKTMPATPGAAPGSAGTLATAGPVRDRKAGPPRPKAEFALRTGCNIRVNGVRGVLMKGPGRPLAVETSRPIPFDGPGGVTHCFHNGRYVNYFPGLQTPRFGVGTYRESLSPYQMNTVMDGQELLIGDRAVSFSSSTLGADLRAAWLDAASTRMTMSVVDVDLAKCPKMSFPAASDLGIVEEGVLHPRTIVAVPTHFLPDSDPTQRYRVNLVSKPGDPVVCLMAAHNVKLPDRLQGASFASRLIRMEGVPLQKVTYLPAETPPMARQSATPYDTSTLPLDGTFVDDVPVEVLAYGVGRPAERSLDPDELAKHSAAARKWLNVSASTELVMVRGSVRDLSHLAQRKLLYPVPSSKKDGLQDFVVNVRTMCRRHWDWTDDPPAIARGARFSPLNDRPSGSRAVQVPTASGTASSGLGTEAVDVVPRTSDFVRMVRFQMEGDFGLIRQRAIHCMRGSDHVLLHRLDGGDLPISDEPLVLAKSTGDSGYRIVRGPAEAIGKLAGFISPQAQTRYFKPDPSAASNPDVVVLP